MLIILGTFVLEDTADRDLWLGKRIDNLVESRNDPGCIEFTLGADPVDKSRVLLVEIWESLELLDAHMQEMPVRGDPTISDGVISFDSMHFEVADVREVDIPKRFAPRSDSPGWWNGSMTASV